MAGLNYINLEMHEKWEEGQKILKQKSNQAVGNDFYFVM